MSVPRTGPVNVTISHLGKYKVVARVTAAVAGQRVQIMSQSGMIQRTAMTNM